LKERRRSDGELPRGKLVLDTSVIVELLLSTIRGNVIKRMIQDGEIIPYVTHITLAEALYVLCRHIGWRTASEKVTSLVRSGYFIVEDVGRIFELSAKYKCERKVSLADCFTLGLAKYVSAPALFAVREKELADENEKRPFDVQILFLEDLLNSVQRTANVD